MLELSYHYDKNPIYLKDIAARQDISLKYLEQLIIPLRVAGLVKNIRGSGGGYTLVNAPRETTLLDIVQTLEGPINLVSCVEDESSCSKAGKCSMQEVWAGVKHRVEDILARTTLEDLYKKQLEYDGDSPEPVRRKSEA